MFMLMLMPLLMSMLLLMSVFMRMIMVMFMFMPLTQYPVHFQLLYFTTPFTHTYSVAILAQVVFLTPASVVVVLASS